MIWEGVKKGYIFANRGPLPPRLLRIFHLCFLATSVGGVNKLCGQGVDHLLIFC